MTRDRTFWTLTASAYAGVLVGLVAIAQMSIGAILLWLFGGVVWGVAGIAALIASPRRWLALLPSALAMLAMAGWWIWVWVQLEGTCLHGDCV